MVCFVQSGVNYCAETFHVVQHQQYQNTKKHMLMLTGCSVAVFLVDSSCSGQYLLGRIVDWQHSAAIQ